jgi:hypothetical protein
VSQADTFDLHSRLNSKTRRRLDNVTLNLALVPLATPPGSRDSDRLWAPSSGLVGILESTIKLSMSII